LSGESSAQLSEHNRVLEEAKLIGEEVSPTADNANANFGWAEYERGLYTVRVQRAKGFCDLVDVEDKNIFDSTKTQLRPLIATTVVYPSLSSYFSSIEKCPTMLQTFSEN
jgi:hypothetical protein